MTDERRSSEGAASGGGKDGRTIKGKGSGDSSNQRPDKPRKAAAKTSGRRKKTAGKAAAGKEAARRSASSKSSPEPQVERAPEPPAENAAADAEAPSGGSAGTSSPSRQESRGLPAFGFAEDLLASKPLAGEDPQRIFAFADRLDSEDREGETETAPVRLATWVTFRLAGEIFALPVEPVREVLRVASITRVPHAPEPIRGVTNVRGRVIPVIDLRLRIGLPAKDLDRASRVMVVRSRGRHLGLLVDAVLQVVHLDLNRVQPPPEDVMTVQSDYITGVYHLGETLVLMLDVDRALVVRGAGPDGTGRAESGRSPGDAGPARRPAARGSSSQDSTAPAT